MTGTDGGQAPGAGLPPGALVRPLAGADVEGVDALARRAFEVLLTGLGHPPGERDEARVAMAHARIRHLLATDPGGCWVAEVDGRPAGTALALRRGDFWGLSLLAVDPDRQSAGLGRALLAAALTTAAGARGMIIATPDARAVRLYSLAGFALHPAMRAAGTVRHRAIPAGLPEVRAGDAGDVGHADAIDLAVRGAPRDSDLELMLGHGARLIVAADGYAVLWDGSPALVAATSEDAARALLWHGLAASEDGCEVHLYSLTAGQQWAMEVALAAGLELQPAGPVFLRGMVPPPWYVPSGAWL